VTSDLAQARLALRARLLGDVTLDTSSLKPYKMGIKRGSVMAHAVLSQPYFHNEAAAFAYVEATLWPYGPVCPHCEATAEKIGALSARTKPSKKNPEGVERHGLRKCYACRKEFTVRVGTIFEDSHLALHLWLQAIHLLSSGKKAFRRATFSGCSIAR